MIINKPKKKPDGCKTTSVLHTGHDYLFVRETDPLLTVKRPVQFLSHKCMVLNEDKPKQNQTIYFLINKKIFFFSCLLTNYLIKT